MWDIIIDWVFRILSKDVVEDTTKDIVKKEFEDIVETTITRRDLIRNKVKSLFSLQRYKHLSFRTWIRQTPKEIVKEKILNVLKKVLRNNGVSERMIAKTLDIWRSENGVKKSLIADNKFPYKYYYLTDTFHSDTAIYRIRALYYSTNDNVVNIGITFKQGETEYRYYRVPLLIFYTMLIIPLTYLTKNGYLAGAYNYFWYTWWYKNPANTLMQNKDLKLYAKKFRFLNKSKKIVNTIKEDRMKNLKLLKGKKTRWIMVKDKH